MRYLKPSILMVSTIAIAFGLFLASAASHTTKTLFRSDDYTSYKTAQRIFGDRPDFFEQGDEVLDREVQRLQQQQPTSTLTVKTGLQIWQPVVSRAGGFSIWIPSGIWTEEAKTIKTAIGTLQFRVFATHVAGSRFVIAYTDPVKVLQTEKPPTLFESVGKAIVERTNFKVANTRSITLENYPGQALQLQVEDEIIDLQMYLAERMYILGIRHPSNESRSRENSDFFSSFQILSSNN